MKIYAIAFLLVSAIALCIVIFYAGYFMGAASTNNRNYQQELMLLKKTFSDDLMNKIEIRMSSLGHATFYANLPNEDYKDACNLIKQSFGTLNYSARISGLNIKEDRSK